MSLLRGAIEYSLGGGLGLVGSVLRVGMTARLLSPDDRGLWIGLQLGYSYGTNLHLGACDAMLREVPMLLARGETQRAARVKQTTYSFVLLTCSLAWAVLFAYIRFGQTHIATHYLLLTALLTSVALLRTYFVSSAKAESRFRDLSISVAIGSVTSIATVGLIWLAGLDGLIFGMVAQTVCELAWLVRADAIPRPAIDGPMLRGLLSVGLLVLVTNLASLFGSSVDRTVMLSRLGTPATGAYYLGANIVTLLPVVASLPTTVLTPRFFEVYGATGRGEALVELVVRSVRLGSVTLAALLGSGVLLLPAVVARLWPNLADGVAAAQVAALGTFPLVLFGLVARVFYAMNRLVAEVFVLAVGGAIGFGCAHAAVTISPTIAAAAAGSVAGLFATFALATALAFYVMVGHWRAGLPLILESMLPCVVAVVVVYGCETLGGWYWPDASFLRAGVSELAFWIVLGPWLLRSLRRLRKEPIR